MSYFNVKRSLCYQLELIADGLPIAQENTEFNPKGLDAFLGAYFQPNAEESLGKAQASGDWARGFFQVSIYVKQNADDLDAQSLDILDKLKAGFRNGTGLNHYGATVHIKESTLNGGFVFDGWFKRDLTVYWATILPR